MLSGCAATGTGNQAPAVNAEAGRALVVGWGGTVGENARAALTPQQGVHISSLFVAKANAQKMPFGQNIARLQPGKYDLTIACGLYIDYRYFPHDTVVEADLRDGHVYRLRAQPQGRKCLPVLDDLANYPAYLLAVPTALGRRLTLSEQSRSPPRST